MYIYYIYSHLGDTVFVDNILKYCLWKDIWPGQPHPQSRHLLWRFLHYWLVCIRTSHEYRANRVACKKLSLIIPPWQHLQANIWVEISFTLPGDLNLLEEMARPPSWFGSRNWVETSKHHIFRTPCADCVTDVSIKSDRFLFYSSSVCYYAA